MAATTKPLTQADIEDGYANEAWLGFGYLGERRYLSAAECEAADTRILAEANARGWTPAEFFAWLNSKLGRWFADGHAGRPTISERDVKATVTLKGIDTT